MKQIVSHHTGAMYSSVPTNEFDCVTGSATNVGGGSLRDLLLPGIACFTTCRKNFQFKHLTIIKLKDDSRISVPLLTLRCNHR